MRILLLIIMCCIGIAAQTTMVTDRVGLNTPDPQVPLHFTVHYPPDTTASEELIRFTTPTGTVGGITHHPFQFYQRSTVFGNDRTDSVGWGFTPAGDPQASPSLAFLMEDSFGTGDDANFELHLQLATSEGGVARPWTWTFNRKNGATTVVTAATSTFYAGSSMLQVNPAEVLTIGKVRHQADSIIFETVANGGAHAKQIRITPHPSDPSLSRLVFGDSAGIGVANVGGELEINRNGTPATVSAGPYKVDGVQVVGQQCPSIPTANKANLADTLNAIVDCMRSHGLVAK